MCCNFYQRGIPFFFVLFVFGATAPQWGPLPSFTTFLDLTKRRITFGRYFYSFFSLGATCRV